MKLKLGKLFWNEGVSTPCYTALEDDMICDVLIVGSGSVGAHTAYFLSKIGMDVTVIDKREIAHGSTAANTGLLQFSQDKSLTSLIHTFGEERGIRAYQLCYEALRTLENVVKELSIDPVFKLRGSLYYASDEKDISLVQEEYNTLKRYGFLVEFLSAAQVSERYSFRKEAALYTSGDAEVNPYLLAHSLLQKAKEQGAQVFKHTEVVHMKRILGEIYCYLSNGKIIKAKSVIMATGYESQFVNRNPNVELSISYAIVTNVQKQFDGWYEKSLIWETARPYLYCRTYKDRVIIGGLDEPFILHKYAENRLLYKRDVLVERVKEMFPFFTDARAEYYWGAIFGGSRDGLPTLREDKEIPNLYYALTYGGNGTVYAMVFAKIFQELFTHGKSSDFCLFQR